MKTYIFLLPFVLFSCGSSTETTDQLEEEESESIMPSSEETAVEEVIVSVPEFVAVIDDEAMQQAAEYTDEDFESTFDFYHSEEYVYDRWTDKLWGRCCTEADLSLCEIMSFIVKTSREGKEYPFANALNVDDPYKTAYVFEKQDSIVISIRLDLSEDQYLGPWQELGTLSKILGDKPVMSQFQYSLINGYVKSEKAFEQNGRIEWVELWLNDEHMCNVKLLDVPDIQMIEGNFPFQKNDVVKIIPISYYEGSTYNDICISTLQQSLSYSCDSSIIEEGNRLAYDY